MITKKVVLIGDFSTGKTSLIRRYVENEFSDEYLTTIGVKISKKNVLELQLMIWDIEGRTDVKTINTTYITGAHGLIVVADFTRKKTIENISTHIKECMEVVKNIPIVLAINKSDLVSESTIDEVLNELKLLFGDIKMIFNTSAKDGRNVENIFLNLSKAMVAKR